MKAIMILLIRMSCITLSVIAPIISYGQFLNTQQNWAENKHEFSLGLGVTGFLGDLGGADQVVADYSLKDVDINSSHIGGSLSYRYRFHRNFATSTMVNMGMLRGSDALTAEPYRNMRNLSFRSFFTMLSQRFEIILLANERVGRKATSIDHNEQLYLIGGIGAMVSIRRQSIRAVGLRCTISTQKDRDLLVGPQNINGLLLLFR